MSKITDKELDLLVDLVEVTSDTKKTDTKKTVDVFKVYNALRTINGHEPVTAEEFKARVLQDSHLAKEL